VLDQAQHQVWTRAPRQMNTLQPLESKVRGGSVTVMQTPAGGAANQRPRAARSREIAERYPHDAAPAQRTERDKLMVSVRESASHPNESDPQ